MSRARKKPLQLGETFELSLHEEAGVSQAVFQIEGEPERGGPGYLWDNEELPPAARPSSCKLSEAWFLSCRQRARSQRVERELNLQVNPGTFSYVLHALKGQLAG